MPDEESTATITTADLVRLFEDLSSYQKEQIAAEMALPLWSKQRGRVYRDMKDRVNSRYLVGGAEVTRDGAGNQVGLEGGKGQFDIVNFVTGTATIDSADNARQINITAGGPGALCWDIIVDSHYTGTQGASTTTFTGSTVYFYSTIQAAVTQAQAINAGSGRDVNVLICCGDYFENVSFTTNGWFGGQGVTLTAQANGEHSPSVVIHGTFALPYSNFAGNAVILDGIKVTGTTTIGTTHAQGNLGDLRPPDFNAFGCRFQGGITYQGAAGGLTLRNSVSLGAFNGSTISATTGGFTFIFDNTALGDLTVNAVLGGFPQYSFSQSTSLVFRNGSSVGLCTVTTGSTIVEFDNSTISTGLRVTASGGAAIVRLRGARFQGNPQAAGIFDYVKFDCLAGFGTSTVYVQVLGCDFPAPQNTTVASPNRYIAFYQSAGTVIYQEPVIVGNTFGRAVSGLSINPDSDVVTSGGASLTNYVIADNAPGGANIISVVGTGTTGGGGGALATDAFVTIGHPADLPNSRAITAGTDIVVTDQGAGGNVLVGHGSPALPDTHHAQLHYKADHTINFGRVYVPFGTIGLPNGMAVTT